VAGDAQGTVPMGGRQKHHGDAIWVEADHGDGDRRERAWRTSAAAGS
jgi:hypothetical protein